MTRDSLRILAIADLQAPGRLAAIALTADDLLMNRHEYLTILRDSI